jgi:hypothetical protein
MNNIHTDARRCLPLFISLMLWSVACGGATTDAATSHGADEALPALQPGQTLFELSDGGWIAETVGTDCNGDAPSGGATLGCCPSYISEDGGICMVCVLMRNCQVITDDSVNCPWLDNTFGPHPICENQDLECCG